MPHFDYDVFLSFASLNENLARPLYERLTGSGLRVFWSDETLKQNVGESWFGVIQKSLESSKHFVLLWSPEAEQSKFVKLEYESFIRESINDDGRRLIPLVVNGYGTDTMPLFLRGYQGYDINGDLKDVISNLGGRFQPLEAEIAQLRAQLEEAQQQNEILKQTRAKDQQAVPEHVQEELDTLKLRYASLEKKHTQEVKKATELLEEKEAQIREFASRIKALEKASTKKTSTSTRKKDTKPVVKSPEQYFTDEYGIEFVLIEPGTFMMGSEKGSSDEKPVHQVEITKPFYLGRYPVTQSQWSAVEGSNSRKFKGESNPVESVSWSDVQKYLQKLQKGDALYRLPTEAEWEYACRAGTTTEYSFGEDSDKLGEYAWYNQNSGKKTHPVGQKKPNPWGLYDMHGNVWEWVQDWYDKGYYKQFQNKTAVDPTGPEKGTYRVFRGGGWSSFAAHLRSASRGNRPPGFAYGIVGFRLLRTIP